MTNSEILSIAMEQSAVDCNCKKEDFTGKENMVVISQKNLGARKYLSLPFQCSLVSYGGNMVASVKEGLEQPVREFMNRYPVAHCFETPNLYALNERLEKEGLKICFMAEYFLPDLQLLRPQPCRYPTRVLLPEEFQDCYLPQWGNALCGARKELDVLAVAAYDGDNMIGMAGCSADCEKMWQIGIDVLPEYRRQGIGVSLTSKLAMETLKRGKVPFYCAAWSNLPSVRNAIKSGFRPAWVEMTARDCEAIDRLNGKSGNR